MPKCKACEHPDVLLINRDLLLGKSERSIAQQYGLTDACIHRHKGHMKRDVNKAIETRKEKVAMKTAEELDGTLCHLLDTAIEIMGEARNEKDKRLALQAMNEARATILAARKIAEGVTVNVQVNNVSISDEEIIARAKSLIA